MEERRWQRLHFRSWHRGTHELDILLGGFADAHLPQFTAEQLDLYEKMLLLNDPDLFTYLTGQGGLAPADITEVTEMVRAYALGRFQID